MLKFKDSDRESVLSYFDKDEMNQSKMFDSVDLKRLDTPTRLVNFSNEFLPQKLKVNPEKLKKKEVDEQLKQKFKNYKDLEEFSDLEKSQKSTLRKNEDEKRERLFKIVTATDIERLKIGI